MLRPILRRLLAVPLILLLVNCFGFAAAHLARAYQISRHPFFSRIEPPPPFVESYGAYLQGALRLDFGRMPGANNPETVAAALARVGVNSLGLLALALALSAALGLLLALAAVRTNPPGIAPWLTLLSTVGLASPSFYTGSLFIIAIIYYMLWSGTRTAIPFQGFGWDIHLALPTLTLMVQPTVQIARLASGLLVEELNKQYVVAARSLGFTWRRVRWWQAMGNIVAPLILVVASSLRLLVGELIIVEWLFSWPGIGRLFATALVVPGRLTMSSPTSAFLHPAIVAAVLTVFAAVFLAADLVASALAGAADPRLREA